MEKLFAPWRIKYISNTKQKKCIFCASFRKSSDNHIVFKTKDTLCMLNIFPYNNGHLMVSPRKHVRDFSQLTDGEILDLIRSVTKSQGLLNRVLKPQGFNIGINLGRAAGAGITGHMHIHIIPRWVGDTNFMPLVYNTKVISQSLKELLNLLKNAESVYDKRIRR